MGKGTTPASFVHLIPSCFVPSPEAARCPVQVILFDLRGQLSIYPHFNVKLLFSAHLTHLLFMFLNPDSSLGGGVAGWVRYRAGGLGIGLCGAKGLAEDTAESHPGWGISQGFGHFNPAGHLF